MKKLQKEFSSNVDKVGLNKFVQLRKENGVAMYERFNTDGSHRSYEVFSIKVIPKGAPLPNGKTVEESYESYPGSSVFGRTAYDCRTLAQAEERFDQLVIKVKESAEAKEESIKSGKPNRGRKSRGEAIKKTIAIPPKGTRFTTKFLVSNSGIPQPLLFPIIKSWHHNGYIQIAGTIKNECGKGRPSIEYIVV